MNHLVSFFFFISCVLLETKDKFCTDRCSAEKACAVNDSKILPAFGETWRLLRCLNVTGAVAATCRMFRQADSARLADSAVNKIKSTVLFYFVLVFFYSGKSFFLILICCFHYLQAHMWRIVARYVTKPIYAARVGFLNLELE